MSDLLDGNEELKRIKDRGELVSGVEGTRERCCVTGKERGKERGEKGGEGTESGHGLGQGKTGRRSTNIPPVSS